MDNLIEYSDNYSKTPGSLWQHYRDEPFINNDGVIIDPPDDPDSASFKSKQKNNRLNRKWWNKRCSYNGTIEIFRRILEMALINYEMNFLNLVWKICIVTRDYGNPEPKFPITDTKLYFPVVTLSAQDNQKLLQQLKTAFKNNFINWNKYQSEPTI